MLHPDVYLIGRGALLWRTLKIWIAHGVTFRAVFHTANEPIPNYVRELSIPIYSLLKENILTIAPFESSNGVLVSINNQFILPDLIIEKFSAAYNIHNGNVSKFRGVAEICIFAAICSGEIEYGVTLQRLSPGEGVDSGKVISNKLFPILIADTFESLMYRTLTECEKLLQESIVPILNFDCGYSVHIASPLVYTLKDVDWIAKKASSTNLKRASQLGLYSSLLPSLMNRINRINN
jgi:methionyl-tRNA formyltransferase